MRRPGPAAAEVNVRAVPFSYIARNLWVRRVTTLLSRQLSSGLQTTAWDGTNAVGSPVSAGTYFLRLQADGRSETSRITVLR